MQILCETDEVGSSKKALESVLKAATDDEEVFVLLLYK